MEGEEEGKGAGGVLVELRDEVRAFAAERDWDQFHSPKNLAAALTVEAAELLEHFQWLQIGDKAELGDSKLAEVRHEMADVLVYLIRIADKLDVDLNAAVREKMALNRAKYPADKVRGSARKYSDYPRD
ncbi:nucleotide pyrophosphohydrolase [Massilia glaciei]|uniref:Nucleotide pyrophosphohydrolase n=1 Tax=Massilia glaciei TaxID=1524097 RepID=A0A2U2HDY1_9BURK|nr:nucleotide pyrophosphohydrolase [Massilia glaciei]PWF41338.1 nucleotide pyrophosphohydrolase [Massilia glaciei]